MTPTAMRLTCALACASVAAGTMLCGPADQQITCEDTKFCRSFQDEKGFHPKCVDHCSNADNCEGNAASVAYVPPVPCGEPYYFNTAACPGLGPCQCDCKEGYTGDTCDACAQKWMPTLGATPIKCELICTSAKKCNDHASNVVWSTGDVCTCTCRNKWDGATCDTCPSPFDAAEDCGQCLEGHIAYPRCTKCTTETHCSGHASSVADNMRKTCDCQCTAPWTGATCSTCPPNYEPTCDKCAAGFVTYPKCVECTNAGNCNGHAKTVSSNDARDTCTCACKTGYTGTVCNACAVGYHGYPTCVKCTSAADCNGHAVEVTSDGITCQCTKCAGSFTGATCNQCAAMYDQATCSTCVEGRVTYPTCRECTVNDDCSGHASAVTDDGTRATCACTCEKWTGDKCETCPVRYKQGSCDACSVGYITYPQCLQCSLAKHCNSHASAVTSNADHTKCDCTCTSKFTGDTCNKCSTNRIIYPDCSECTIPASCNNHATAVKANVPQTACICTCSPPWIGDKCQTCPPNFKQSTCASCAVGYVNYPTCAQCTSTDHCNGNARAVTSNGDNTQCVCTCKTGFTGATCNKCDTNYIGYPSCTKCTTAKHCSSHADAVVSNADNTKCVCTCSQKWTGDKCETCPPTYDQTGGFCTCANQWTGAKCEICPPKFGGADCNKCAADRIQYPACTECTAADSCNGKATSVQPNPDQTACVCGCSDHWTGAQCDVCPTQYKQDTCDACATGYITLPTCTQCTNAVHCNGHASSVTSNGDNTQCMCTCKAGYTGATCNKCDTKYIGYPSCTKCTTAKHCNRNAKAVTSNADNTACDCTCADKWTGATCDVCPDMFDASFDCKNCAAGRVAYPTCRECTVADDCSGHATSTTDDNNRVACVCTCKDAWTGTKCETCPPKYAAPCNVCAVGHIDYPTCTECTSAKHCNNRATDVTSDATKENCVCTCKNQWKGATCDECDAKFDSKDDCNSCAAGHIGTPPTCTKCDVATHCNSHASAVTDNMRTTCVCTCRNQWDPATACKVCPAKFGGADCDECAAGFIGYPNCVKCTAEAHCSSHAPTSTPNAAKTECTCACSDQWTSDDCSTCPAKYSAACNQCAPTHITYPTCTKCTNAAHCSGNADSVTDKDNTECVCTCKTGYEGKKCDACKAGFIGPPCVKCTIADHCEGHATAVVSNAGKTACVCTCENHWTGDSCQTCPPPFDGINCDRCLPQYTGANCDQCQVGHIKPDCTPCTSTQHCNDHAKLSTDDGTRTSCTCDCLAAYTGATCNACAAGHIGYPACTQCTVDKHCSGHATAVTNKGLTACQCTCSNKWSGDDCSVCPPQFDAKKDCNSCAVGFINFPACTACDKAAHCSGHASAVTSDAKFEACECTCNTKWTGDDCSVCPPKYDSSDNCASCAPPVRIAFPACDECTNATCTMHASAVKANAGATACECTCLAPWTGPTCAVCPPKYQGTKCDACAANHITYPQCTLCTSADHCNDHAKTVSDDGMNTACVCTCAAPYEGDTCNACMAGHIDYPNCRACDVTTDCKGRAQTVTDKGRTSCVCACDNQWTGDLCDVCPLPKYGGADCNECAPGRINYPTCTECTSADHCNSRSSTVTAQGNTCVCDCATQWVGAACETCPPSFGPPNCGACAVGRIEYPTCTLCSVDVHCSMHGASVTSDAAKAKCVCTCRNKWEGEKCDVCPPQYTGDCDACNVGHIKPFPACTECTNDVHCSSHAVNVTDDGERQSCRCTCRNQWSGDDCSVCPPQFGGADCDECAMQGIGYPVCGDCTVDGFCSSHAVSVVPDATKTSCICTCRNQWTGPKCDTCPPQFSGDDCEKCAAGYTGYPNCTECTSAVHCNNRATSVTDDGTGAKCVCTCENQWTGDSCDVCPDKFEGDECNRCAPGHIGYPACTKCDESHCNFHSTSVTDDGTRTTCECVCRNKWSNATCGACELPYAGDDCRLCAEGHINYDTCTKCTIADHCSSHAVNVTTGVLGRSCECTCENQWSGSSCEKCESPFDGANCDKCLEGHIGYPTCTECTSAMHCNDRATDVTDKNGTSCACTCRNAWAGAACETCPTAYGGDDCEMCAKGYIGSLATECTQCSNAKHCNSRAKMERDEMLGWAPNVTDNGNRSTCVCVCSGQWSGDQCETCPPQFGGDECNECAPLRVGYPECVLCDVDVHCSGHADTVMPVNATTCECQCTAMWTGAKCDSCPANYDQTTCDRCHPGFINYPKCTECTVGVHCSDHAVNVTSNAAADTCECTCRNMWSGDTCSTCNSTIYAGNDCNECSTGYLNYPLCGYACHTDLNCSSHADSVVFDAATEKCACTCSDKFTGDSCEICDAKYSQARCDACAVGYITFPDCTQCTSNASCSGHASNVTTDLAQTKCVCDCDNFWKGDTCDSCPAGMDDDCLKCAVGWTGTAPNCVKCTADVHCNSHSVNVTATVDACVCECRNKWTGSSCNTCPAKYAASDDCGSCTPGLMGFPDCLPSCVLDRNCTAGHASKVRWAPADQCICDCVDQWSGPTCGVCPERFDNTTCSECAEGYINYPLCTKCSIDDVCNGNAVSATDDGTRSTCSCTCANSWAGALCDTCPSPFGGAHCDICGPGRINFPACTLCSLDVTCGGHAAAVDSDDDQKQCICTCRNQWTGPACDVCPDLYDGADCDVCGAKRAGFPQCGVPCLVATNCSGHASDVDFVKVVGGTDYCNCNCTAPWEGSDCSLCPEPFTGEQCNECMNGTIMASPLPNLVCTECSLDECNGRGVNVTDDGTRTSCVCTCEGNWSGDKCENCTANYEGNDCDRCAEGFGFYPACTVCFGDNCGHKGGSVTPTLTPTLTLTPAVQVTQTNGSEDFLGAGESEGSDDDCWKPFVGACWWLLVLGILVLLCCCFVLFLLWKRFKRDDANKELEMEAVGEETFDKYAELAEENELLVLAPDAQELAPMPNFRDTEGAVVPPIGSDVGSSIHDPLLLSQSPGPATATAASADVADHHDI